MNEHLNLPQTYRYSQWRFMKVRDRLTPQAGQQRKSVISLPPPLLVFLSIISVQLGAAFAKSLFQTGVVLVAGSGWQWCAFGSKSIGRQTADAGGAR